MALPGASGNSSAEVEEMRASELHKSEYKDFPEFEKYGIPLQYIDAALISLLQQIRTRTGIPIIPSPVREGWVRFDGSKTSRHYASNRLSDAGDIFPQRERVTELWLRMQAVKRIGAIGLYADTKGPDGKPWPMIHFDLRETKDKILWARDGNYYYLPQNREEFWRTLVKIIKMEGGV